MTSAKAKAAPGHLDHVGVHKAESVLAVVGMTSDEAVAFFYKQTALRGSLPFPKVPMSPRCYLSSSPNATNGGPRYHLKSGLLPVDSRLRQPKGHGYSHAPDCSSFGHPKSSTCPATKQVWLSSGAVNTRTDKDGPPGLAEIANAKHEIVRLFVRIHPRLQNQRDRER